MTSTHTAALLRLFRLAASSQPPSGGPHPLDDEELLTCWSLGQLPPPEQTALIEHLSLCASCRGRLAELVRAGVFALPEPPASAPSRPRRGHRRLVWMLAAAAVLLLCLAWLAFPRGPRAELARAERDLAAGNDAAALVRLEQLDRDEVDPATRERARQLLEQAAYRLARRQLEESNFAQVADIAQRAAEHGISSARLVNLRLQAERRIPAETALASAWSLLSYGYELDGASFNKALPEVDAPSKQINEQLARAVQDHPQEALLRVNHGQLLLTQGQLEAARKRFREALEVDGRRADAHLGLGLTAFQEDRPAEALEHFQAALEIEPDSIPGHLNAAICLHQLNKPEEARQHRQRVLELTRDAGLRRRIEQYQAR